MAWARREFTFFIAAAVALGFGFVTKTVLIPHLADAGGCSRCVEATCFSPCPTSEELVLLRRVGGHVLQTLLKTEQDALYDHRAVQA